MAEQQVLNWGLSFGKLGASLGCNKVLYLLSQGEGIINTTVASATGIILQVPKCNSLESHKLPHGKQSLGCSSSQLS